MESHYIWNPTDDVLKQVPCTCIDGRTKGLRYSVAGGSVGLLIWILNDLNQKNPLDFETIELIMLDFSQEIAPLYLHSDQHALEEIYHKLRVQETTKLEDLTQDQKQMFMILAATGAYRGCGHLKLMMQHIEEYQVDISLIQEVIFIFFKQFFLKTPNFLFDVLAGRHAEEQVVIINCEAMQAGQGRSVLFDGEHSIGEQFFCHRPLKHLLVKRIVDRLQLRFPRVALDAAALADSNDRIAEKTLAYLAPNLDIQKVCL